MGLPPQPALERLMGQDPQPEKPDRKRRARRSRRVAAILAESKKQAQSARVVERGASDARKAATQAGVEIAPADNAELQIEAQEARQAQTTLQERVRSAKAELGGLIKAKQAEVDALRTEADELSAFTVRDARKLSGELAVDAAQKAEQELEALYTASQGESQSTALAKQQLGGLRRVRRERAKWHVRREKTRATQERVDRRADKKTSRTRRFFDAMRDLPGRITGKAYEEWTDSWEAQGMQPLVQDQYDAKVAEVVGDNHMARLEEHIALTTEKVAEMRAQDNSFYTKYYEPIGRASMEQVFDLDSSTYGGVGKFFARTVTVDRVVKAALTSSIAMTAGPVAPTMAAAGMLGMRTANAVLFYTRAERSQKRGALRGTADKLLTQENTNVTTLEHLSKAAGTVLQPVGRVLGAGFQAAGDAKNFFTSDRSASEKIDGVIDTITPEDGETFGEYISKGVGRFVELVRGNPDQMPTEIEKMSSEQLLTNIGDLLAWAEISGTRLGANVFEKYKGFGVDEHRELTAGEVLDALLAEYGKRLGDERSPEQVEASADDISRVLGTENEAVDQILESRFVSAKDREKTIQKISVGIGAGAGFVLPAAVKHGLAGSLWILSEMIGEASAETFDITDPAHFSMLQDSEYAGGAVAPGVEMHVGTSELALLERIGLEHVEGLTFRDETGTTFELPIITRAQGNANSGVLPTADIAITQQTVNVEEGAGSAGKIIVTLYDTAGELQYSYAVSDDGSDPGSQLIRSGQASNREYIMAASDSPRLFMHGREEDPLLGAYGDKRDEAAAAHAVHEMSPGSAGLVESQYAHMTVRFKEGDVAALEEMGFNGFDEDNKGAILYRDTFGTERTLPIKQVSPETAAASPYKEASAEVVITESNGNVVVSVYDVHGDLQLSVSGDSFATIASNMRMAEPYSSLGVSDSTVMDSSYTIPLQRPETNPLQEQARQPSMIGGSGARPVSAPRDVQPFQPVVDHVAPGREVAAPIELIPAETVLQFAHKFDDDQVVAKLYEMANGDETFTLGDTEITVITRPVQPGVIGGEQGLVVWIGGDKVRITDENLVETIDRIQALAEAANPDPTPEAGPTLAPELQEEVQGFLRAIGDPPGRPAIGEAGNVTSDISGAFGEGARADFLHLVQTYSEYLKYEDQLNSDTQMRDKIVSVDTGKKVRVSKIFTEEQLAFSRRFEQFLEANGNPGSITAEHYEDYIAEAQRGLLGENSSGQIDATVAAGDVDFSREALARLDAADVTVQEARLMGDAQRYLEFMQQSYLTEDEMSRYQPEGVFDEQYQIRQIQGLVERFGVEDGAGLLKSVTLQKGDDIIRFHVVGDQTAENYGEVIVQVGLEGTHVDVSEIPADLHTYDLVEFDHPSLHHDTTGMANTYYGGEEYRNQELLYDPEDPDSYRADGSFKGTPVEESGGYDPMAARADRYAEAMMRRSQNNRKLGWRDYVSTDTRHGYTGGRAPLETGITQEDTTQEALAKLYAMPGKVREVREQEQMVARVLARRWQNGREIAGEMQEPIQFGETKAIDAQVRQASLEQFRRGGGTSILKVEESGTITMPGDEEFGDPAFTYEKQDGIAVFEQRRPGGRRYDVHFEGEWDKTIDMNEAERYLLKDDWEDVLRRSMMVRDSEGRVIRGMPETMPANPLTGEVPPGGLDAYFTRTLENVRYLAACFETMQAMIDAGVDREYDPELLAKDPPVYKLKNTPEFDSLLREIRRVERIINKNAILLREPEDPQEAWREATDDLPRIRY